MLDRIQGTATPEGTARFANRFPRVAAGHFQKSMGLTMSSIGVGTYLGEADRRTDELYKQSIVRAVQMGSNVIDSAINYRFQRSERAICAAPKELQKDGFRREELIVSTKAGFLSFDGEPPPDTSEYFEKQYLNSGLLSSGEIAAGSHCIAPRYLEDQLNRSLGNLGLQTIDLFYIHNPEIQLEEIEYQHFSKRLHGAFEFLESAVGDKLLSTLEAAGELVIAIMASASMHQARLTRNLPEFLGTHFPNLATDAQRAIQFVRSTSGITSALVGMCRPRHIEENLRLVEIPLAPANSIQTLVNAA